MRERTIVWESTLATERTIVPKRTIMRERWKGECVRSDLSRADPSCNSRGREDAFAQYYLPHSYPESNFRKKHPPKNQRTATSSAPAAIAGREGSCGRARSCRKERLQVSGRERSGGRERSCGSERLRDVYREPAISHRVGRNGGGGELEVKLLETHLLWLLGSPRQPTVTLRTSFVLLAIFRASTVGLASHWGLELFSRKPRESYLSDLSDGEGRPKVSKGTRVAQFAGDWFKWPYTCSSYNSGQSCKATSCIGAKRTINVQHAIAR